MNLEALEDQRLFKGGLVSHMCSAKIQPYDTATLGALEFLGSRYGSILQDDSLSSAKHVKPNVG